MFSDGVGGREVTRDVVVTKSDANVLGDIAGMHHVGASDWHLNLQALSIVRDLFDDKTHLLGALTNLFDIETEAEGTVDVIEFNIKLASLQVRVHFGLTSGFVEDLDLLNSELVLSFTVA